MSKVFIEETTLTNIGSAIREKTGKSDLIAPGDMPAEIRAIVSGGGGGAEVEPIVLTGDCSYACAGAVASAYIDLYGNAITTNKVSNANYMFHKNENENIPFDINCSSSSVINVGYMFNNATKLKSLPKIVNCKPDRLENLFNGCENLREIPEDYFDDWDFSAIDNATNAYSASASRMFGNCCSLRRIPEELLSHMNPNAGYSYLPFYNLAIYCYALDEITGLTLNTNTTMTSNMFGSTINFCLRIKNFMFKTPNNQPYVVKMKNQTIDFTTFTGYCSSAADRDNLLKYNSGITADKEVKDDATYQALKDDPDWFGFGLAYSRYNHDSAVATINSLPDTSAYLASAGGTNTIKFKGAAGAKTDGGAINTLTEEEIAVAAAKGWTVTFV